MKRLLITTFCLVLSTSRLFASAWKVAESDPTIIHRCVRLITDVIVHDIYAPPVASRTYAYIAIAGYEAARHGQPGYLSFAGQVKDLVPVPAPSAGEEYCYALAASVAILQVGRTMVISENLVDEFQQSVFLHFKKLHVPDDVYERSVSYGKLVAEHIIRWSQHDNYRETRSLPRYDISDHNDSWQPTPPAYIKAIEPHWSRIRCFVTESSQQFKPAEAIPFSVDTAGEFYRAATAVYKAGLKLTKTQAAIANFWDCNPFKMNVRGHVMIATKKISPGGHWINITKLACVKSRASLMKSLEAYACLSITLSDAFVSCWDEKYRSNVIRPETYINQYIDKNWVPLLQTPPFPEYTSGHSVISAAASVVLTKLFGNQFNFLDSTETSFGLPVRSFSSFNAAAREAAISRFYGGIHYMNAITNGFDEGDRIGRYAIRKLQMRKEN